MNDSSRREWHRLFNAALNGTLADAERTQLADLLRSSPGARQLWFVYLDNECALAELAPTVLAAGAGARPAAADVTLPGPRGTRWWQGRALTAAAAGLVLGLCGASAGYALAAYRAAEQRTPVALFAAGFETENLTLGHGLPRRAGQWGGYAAAVVPGLPDLPAKEGRFMLRIDPPARGAGRLFQVLDLTSIPPDRRGRAREIEISASVATAGAETGVRFFIRAFAVTESPDQIDGAWFDRREDSIAAVARGVDLAPGTSGWQPLAVSLPLPRDARSVVLFLGVRIPDKHARAFPLYLDDVRATLVTAPILP